MKKRRALRASDTNKEYVYNVRPEHTLLSAQFLRTTLPLPLIVLMANFSSDLLSGICTGKLLRQQKQTKTT